MATRKDLDDFYAQVHGLLQIDRATRGMPVILPMRGWAISPDTMTWVLSSVQLRENPTVVEFGSGQSTIILASVLKQAGGRLISVEHDPEYSSVVQKKLHSLRLSDSVTLHTVPLSIWPEDPEIVSYDLSRLPNLEIDVALVDGPPIANGPLTRYPPLSWSISHLAQSGVAFLDDCIRSEEQACARRVLEEVSNLRSMERPAEKGLIEFGF